MLEEAERAAERVLAAVPAHLWDGSAVPVPVEDIVDSCFGLHVREVARMDDAPGAPALRPGQSFSGLLLPSVREIWVNAEEAGKWPPRRRFTIAHELGHWVLHATARDGVFCRHGSVAAEEEKPEVPPGEQEANAFAAALLMPAALVRRRYEAVKRRGGDPFPALCAMFGSSRAAMGRRLHRAVPRSPG